MVSVRVAIVTPDTWRLFWLAVAAGLLTPLLALVACIAWYGLTDAIRCRWRRRSAWARRTGASTGPAGHSG